MQSFQVHSLIYVYLPPQALLNAHLARTKALKTSQALDACGLYRVYPVFLDENQLKLPKRAKEFSRIFWLRSERNGETNFA